MISGVFFLDLQADHLGEIYRLIYQLEEGEQGNTTMVKRRSFPYSNRSPAAPSGGFISLGSASGSNASIGGTWTHEFICYNNVKSEYTPSSFELSMLRTADSRTGMGRKKVVFKYERGQHKYVCETLKGYFLRKGYFCFV